MCAYFILPFSDWLISKYIVCSKSLFHSEEYFYGPVMWLANHCKGYHTSKKCPYTTCYKLGWVGLHMQNSSTPSKLHFVDHRLMFQLKWKRYMRLEKTSLSLNHVQIRYHVNAYELDTKMGLYCLPFFRFIHLIVFKMQTTAFYRWM